MQLGTLLATGIFLIAIPIVATLLKQPFYVDFCRRIVIMSIAVVSLDLILGFGGLVSLGHASFLGIGAYAVAILSSYGIDNGYLQLLVAVTFSALFAYATGMLALRTAGVSFIMLTLAFSQVLYFLAVAVKAYGAEDGLPLQRPTQFGPWIDLNDGLAFYFLCLFLLGIVLVVCERIVRSRFGVALQGFRSNERQMAALGYPKIPYQLTAFVGSGVLCGIAGMLLVNHVEYVSPDYVHWTQSGDLLIMLILGGRRSLVGAILGTATYLGLDLGLSHFTAHWLLIFSPMLLGVVLVTDRGIFGLIVAVLSKSRS